MEFSILIPHDSCRKRANCINENQISCQKQLSAASCAIEKLLKNFSCYKPAFFRRTKLNNSCRAFLTLVFVNSLHVD